MDENKYRGTDPKDETVERLNDRIDEFRQQAEQAVYEVKHEAREAKKEVKREARANLREVKDTVRDAKDREPYTETGGAYEEESMKEWAKEVKRNIKDQEKATRDVIDFRADRFEEGMERISDDIENQSELFGVALEGNTSPIRPDGTYRAKDGRGTPQDYIERVERHTEETKERIRQEVDNTEEILRYQTEKLKREE